jgi:cell division protein FtsX
MVVEADVPRSREETAMSFVDWAPFLVVFLVAAAAGVLFTGRLAWVIAVFLPLAHFAVSIATGRANEDFLDYVVPVNLVLLAIAVIGVLGGHWLRKRQLSR